LILSLSTKASEIEYLRIYEIVSVALKDVCKIIQLMILESDKNPLNIDNYLLIKELIICVSMILKNIFSMKLD
jgi:hypothetical protein